MLVPHVAASANLNLPLVGDILRRDGAFVLRRSFKGNKLYAAVFNEYLHMMIAKGYPIEYFVEGSRSRTGRLLAPMAGLLSQNISLSCKQLLRLAHTVYQFLRAELFLRWSEVDLEDELDRHVAALTGMGWLARGARDDLYVAPDLNSNEHAQLALLGQAVRPTLIRYFITLATLHENGKIHFGEALQQASGDARLVLPPDVRQASLQMARVDADVAAGVLAGATEKRNA